jgi:hypothetical protein
MRGRSQSERTVSYHHFERWITAFCVSWSRTSDWAERALHIRGILDKKAIFYINAAFIQRLTHYDGSVRHLAGMLGQVPELH